MVKNIVDIRNNKFIITDSGFFGIDTTNPMAKLQIGEDTSSIASSTSILQIGSNLVVTPNKIGIGKYPKETLNINGHVKIENDIFQSIVFSLRDTLPGSEADDSKLTGEIRFKNDSGGSEFQIWNKISETAPMQMNLNINRYGALGLNGNFGDDGQVLTSRGPNFSPEWIDIPSGGVGGGYNQDLNATNDVNFNSVSIQDEVVLTTNGISVNNSVLKLDNSRIQVGTNFGNDGQVLTSRGTNSPEWVSTDTFLQGSDDDVTFNSVSIIGGDAVTSLTTNGASINNSVLELTNSYIKLGSDEGISGQVLTSRGTNSPEWVSPLGGDLASGFYEPFGLGLTGGLETMVNQTIYFSAFYTSIAVNYRKIILYTSENFISFNGTLGIAIYSNNGGVPGSIYSSKTILLDLSSPGSEIEISINFNLNAYTKYWLGIGSSSTSGSLSLAKSVITNDGNLHIKSLPDLFTPTTGGGSFFPGVVTATAITISPLNFWFRLYNPNIATFHELVDSGGDDVINIYKSSDPANIIEAKIETQTVDGPSANLEFKLLHDSTLKKRFSILSTGEIVLGTGANGRGQAGYVLTSRGAGLPEWAPPNSTDSVGAESSGGASSYPHSSIDQRTNYEANFRLASSLAGSGSFSTPNGDEWEIIHTDTTAEMPIPPANERVHNTIFGVKLGNDIRYRSREAIRRVTRQHESHIEIHAGTVFSIEITHASNHDETNITPIHPIIFSCWNNVGGGDNWRPGDSPTASNNRFAIFYHDSSQDNSRIAIEFGTTYRIVSNEYLLTRTRVADANQRVQHTIFSFDNATGIAYGSIDGEQLTFKYGYIDSTKYGIDYTTNLSDIPIVNMWPVGHIITPDEVYLGLDPFSVRGTRLISTPDSVWGKIAIYNLLNLVQESNTPGINNSSYEKYLLTDPYLEKQKIANSGSAGSYSKNLDQSLSANGDITGNWTTLVAFNNITNNNNGTFTINTDGNYQISYVVYVVKSGSGASITQSGVDLRRTRGGTTTSLNNHYFVDNGGADYYEYFSHSYTFLDQFFKNDVIKLFVRTDGQTFSVKGSYNGSEPHKTYLSVLKC